MFASGASIACATLLSACGGGGGGGGPGDQPRATVMTFENTYRMDYQFDAESRIKSYEMRDDASNKLAEWCNGDLHGSWDCRDEIRAPFSSSSFKIDTQSRPSSFTWFSEISGGGSALYSYDADGRLTGVDSQHSPGPVVFTVTSTLEYGAAGQLASIRVKKFNTFMGVTSDLIFKVTPPSAAPTQILVTQADVPDTAVFTIRLDHDESGHFTQKTVREVTASDDRLASTVSYVIDSHAYVTGRISEQYSYDPGLTPVIRTEESWCLDWSASADAALASESSCSPSLTYYSIVYPATQMPSAPLTVFPAYSASSSMDLLCIIAGCDDPARWPTWRPF